MVDYTQVLSKDTSVKEIGVLDHPTPTGNGISDFTFRKVYSVFDWGVMPMPEGKEVDNTTIVLMAALNFEMFEREGIKTHYLGMVDENGDLITFEDAKRLGKTPSIIRIKYVNRLPVPFKDGKYDYSVFQNPPANNYIHPLEYIFRNKLGKDASVWERIKKGNVSLSDFGLPETLNPGDPLPFPVLDYSTKFEKGDRYLKPEEARILAGLSKDRFGRVNERIHMANKLLTNYALSLGFDHEDGKVELVRIGDFDLIGDVAGTWHEDRYLYGPDGMKISKQPYRDMNKILNPEWACEIEIKKKEAIQRGIEDWKSLMTTKPDPLPPEFFDVMNNLFRAGTNHYTQHTFYPDASSLEEAFKEFKRFSESVSK